MRKSCRFSLKKAIMLKGLMTLLLTFTVMAAMAQQLEVTGKVLNKKNSKPLPGVSVLAVQTNQGTVTDADGSFQIEVEQGTNLKFSFIGFKEQTVTVTDDKPLTVQLVSETVGLDEVVVVGYGVQKRSDLTGSVASVKAEEIEDAPVLGVDQALQGKVAGVQVTNNTGAPGSSVSVRIRGINTINDMEPLYVVDGMPVEDIKFLNPGDIESLEVLKDASSAAIYGARGANGVVLITTKQGEKGEPSLSFDAYYGMQSVWNEPDLLSGPQYYEVMQTAYDFGYNNAKDFELVAPADDPEHTTNWFDEISRSAPKQKYNLSLSGGSENSRYAVSGSYFNQQGTVEKSDYERITFRVNTDHTIMDRLTIGEKMTVTHTSKNAIAEGDYFNGILNSALKLDPLTPVKDDEGDFVSSPYTDVNNPVARLHFDNDTRKHLYLVGNVYADYEIIEGLNFKSDFGLNLRRQDNYGFDPTYHLANDEQNQVSKVRRSYYKENQWNWINTLTFSKEFDKHSVTVMAGTEAVSNRYEWITASTDSVISNNESFRYLDAGLTNDKAEGKATEWAQMSYFGRFNYDFDNRYLFQATVRRDGSSRFGEDKRWGIFPSFSAGWNVTNEAFMQGANVLSRLKIRGSWGKLGNDAIGLYQYASTVSFDDRYKYVLGGSNEDQSVVMGAAPSYSGNTEIKWEEQISTTAGVDFGFFKNQITGTIEYFTKNTVDMLYYEPIPDYTGYLSAPATNVAELENKGFDFSINYRRSEGDFSYDIGFNLSTFNTEIKSLGKGDKPLMTGYMRIGSVCRTEVGHEPGAFWGYQTDGIFSSEEEIEQHSYTNEEGETELIQPSAIPGDYKFKDIGRFDEDGNFVAKPDGQIDEADKTYIGSPHPDFTYGLNISARYKMFDLSLFFQGTYGNDIFNFVEFYTMSPSDVWNKSTEILEALDETKNALQQLENSDTYTYNADVPILNYTDQNDNMRLSDRYIEDGSYLRLKNAQIGFTLPAKITQKVNMQKCRIYVAGHNLLTFTDYSGLDPEIGRVYGYGNLTNGIDLGTYPHARLIMVGANITF